MLLPQRIILFNSQTKRHLQRNPKFYDGIPWIHGIFPWLLFLKKNLNVELVFNTCNSKTQQVDFCESTGWCLFLKVYLQNY